MKARTVGFVTSGLIVALVMAFGLSRLASPAPDGLEKVAADHALDSGAAGPSAAPFGDYALSGIDDDGLSTGVAGVIGVAVTFVLGSGLAVALTRRSSRHGAADHP